MKKSQLRIMLAALAAVFVLTGLAAASASAALPEFSPGLLPTKFTGTGGEMFIEETSGAGKYVCSSTSITGTITGPKALANVVVKFKSHNRGCAFCFQEKSEEWQSRELKGSIGYISKTAKTVGLLLEPTSGAFAECAGHLTLPAKVTGSLMGAITPVNSATSKFTAAYHQEHGIQSLQHFEGEEALHNLEIVTIPVTRKFGLEGSISLTTEQFLELKA